MMPPLAVAQALELDWLSQRPAIDDRLTILPLCWRFITGITAWQRSSFCHSSSVSSSTGELRP
jgi:hypothetical protein